MRKILLAGEESHERPALLRHAISNRADQHREIGLKRVKHRSGRHRGSGHGFFRGGDDDNHQGAGRFGLLDLPEPVSSADSNFNRGVSASEFRQAAGQRFLALDLEHHGYLTLAELKSIRPAPPPEPSREVIPGQTPTDSDSTQQLPPE